MTIIIPTRLERHSIYGLVEAAVKVDDVLLVYTEAGLNKFHGDHIKVVEDFSRNIQSWWNTGMDYADEKALVLNDDILCDPLDLLDMLDELEVSDLVYTGGRPSDHASPLSGWAWGVRRNAIRPDPQFQWWYGEDDMYHRAVQQGLKITMVETNIQHMPRAAGFADFGLANAVVDDGILYHQRWKKK